ncbi:MAG: MaoC family dehydratase [Bacillota bacterium]
MERGKSFEELQLGDKAAFTKTITEADIILFAGLSGDFNPVHVDSEYSKKTQFKERIAHGPLTLSLIAPVIGMKLPGLGSVLLDIQARFHRPVRIGDTITAEAEVSEKLAKNKFVRFKMRFVNQNGVEVITGSVLVLPPEKE